MRCRTDNRNASSETIESMTGETPGAAWRDGERHPGQKAPALELGGGPRNCPRSPDQIRKAAEKPSIVWEAPRLVPTKEKRGSGSAIEMMAWKVERG